MTEEVKAMQLRYRSDIRTAACRWNQKKILFISYARHLAEFSPP